MPVVPFIPHLISAGGAIAGGVIQNNAANDAQEAQEKAAERALNLQRDMYVQQRNDLAPFRQGGAAAFSTLGSLMGLPASGPEQTVPGLTDTSAPYGFRNAARNPTQPNNTALVPRENYTGEFAVPRGMAGMIPTAGAAPNATDPQAKSQSGYVMMRAPNGTVGQVPSSAVDRALAAGGQRVEG